MFIFNKELIKCFMYKIKINSNGFNCPMINKTITERGDINFGTCRLCKNNVLGKFVDDYCYCNYGSSSGGSSGGNSGSDEPTPIEEYDPWNTYDPNN